MEIPPPFWEHRRFIGGAPERVWAALTVPDELNRWETATAELEPRVGGRVRLTFQFGLAEEGRVVEFEPPRRLGLLWTHPYEFNGPQARAILCTYVLTPVEDGTELDIRLEEFGDDEQQQFLYEGMAQGYEKDTINLKIYVETGLDGRPVTWRGVDFGAYAITVRDSWRARLGVGGGAYLLDAFEGGGAHAAGCRSGDVVVALGGFPVDTYRDLFAAVNAYAPGDRVLVEFVRDRRRRFGEAILADAYGFANKRRRFDSLLRRAQQWGTTWTVEELEAFHLGQVSSPADG